MPKQRNTSASQPADGQEVRRRAASRPRKPSGAAAPRQRFPIVGVGASAGGLDAFRHLLPALGDAPGVALVLVPHLEPHHKSHLAELLARITPLPLAEATDGMRVEPNRVYVLPAAFFLAIEDGVLRLTPRGSRNLPIDFFLRTLAEGHGERAVGVVLSGTGADGRLSRLSGKSARARVRRVVQLRGSTVCSYPSAPVQRPR